jgi:hypothetical protein
MVCRVVPPVEEVKCWSDRRPQRSGVSIFDGGHFRSGVPRSLPWGEGEIRIVEDTPREVSHILTFIMLEISLCLYILDYVGIRLVKSPV